jgi:ABC-type lipoprotein release transport system permease subunit
LTTGAALAFGISLCVASYGLMDGLNAQLLDALTKLDLGHVQVHRSEFVSRRKLEHAMSAAEAEAALETAGRHAGVRAVAPRSYAYALVSAGRKSAGVELVGVDPTDEPQVTTLHQRLVEGSYLDAEPTPWKQGRALSAAEQQADEKLTEAAEEEALAELDELQALDGAAGEAAGEPVAADGAPAKPGASPAARTSKETTRALALAIAPPPDRPPRVFVGKSLARVLALRVGGQLYVTAQTVDGLTESVFLEVAGIFETGTPIYDRHRLYLHISDLQRLVHLDGRPHEVALAAVQPSRAPELALALRASVGEGDLLVRPWSEIRPDIRQMLEINSVSTGLMVLIIFIVATLGVVNTMLMSVFERTRELGVLKAIGMSGRRIVSLIVTETLLLVLGSSLVGTAIGLGLDGYMMRYGVDFSGFTEGISFAGMGIDPVVYGAITPQGVLVPTVVLSLMCLIASLYPAVRAARLQPAVGMRET